MTKKGLPPVFSCDQARERRRLRRARMERVGDEPRRRAPARAAPSTRLVDRARPPPAHLVQREHQRVRRRRPRCRGRRRSASRWPRLGVGQQVLEQLEAGRVRPLQVVEEEHQRVLRPGERRRRTGGAPCAKRCLRLGRRQLGHRRLRADDQLELRDQVDEELAVASRAPPRAAAASAATLSSLSARISRTSSRKAWTRRGVGDVALELVELAARKKARARARSACAARAPATTCRCRSSPRPARAPASPLPPRARTPRAARRSRARGRRAAAGCGSGRTRRARPAGTARSARCSRHCAQAALEVGASPRALW